MTAEELWRLDLYLKVLATNTFERVQNFARSIAGMPSILLRFALALRKSFNCSSKWTHRSRGRVFEY
ncbi:hypothetical protein DL93DRAFT_2086201 [Clavulina sp. PMI_390]|nr:hypothetical protein DL93DRAFT_2086201 [Clavulina sp. PMI_390]